MRDEPLTHRDLEAKRAALITKKYTNGFVGRTVKDDEDLRRIEEVLDAIDLEVCARAIRQREAEVAHVEKLAALWQRAADHAWRMRRALSGRKRR